MPRCSDVCLTRDTSPSDWKRCAHFWERCVVASIPAKSMPLALLKILFIRSSAGADPAPITPAPWTRPPYPASRSPATTSRSNTFCAVKWITRHSLNWSPGRGPVQGLLRQSFYGIANFIVNFLQVVQVGCEKKKKKKTVAYVLLALRSIIVESIRKFRRSYSILSVCAEPAHTQNAFFYIFRIDS